jgi:hypothetical protein
MPIAHIADIEMCQTKGCGIVSIVLSFLPGNGALPRVNLSAYECKTSILHTPTTCLPIVKAL